MKTYPNRTRAPYGVYASLKPMDVRFVGSEGELIEGRDDANYLRLPAWAVLLVSPLLGLAFVVAFPVIVMVAALGALGEVALKAVRPVAHSQAPLVRVRWEPVASYLDGEGNEPQGEGEPDEELSDLADEVRAARENEGRESEED